MERELAMRFSLVAEVLVVNIIHHRPTYGVEVPVAFKVDFSSKVSAGVSLADWMLAIISSTF